MSTANAGSSALEEEFLQKTDAEIEKLEPMKAEYDRLVALRSRLIGSGARGKTPAARASGGSTPRARQGNRQEQFLQLVKAEPGITIPQLAEKMEIASNYLYRIRTAAVKKGQVTVTNANIFPAEPSA